MPVICVFGDSTAWGAWDLDQGGWVNRLWLDYANEDKETHIYNLSISGGTTETILERFESEAKVREADIIIFQSGGNDSAYDQDSREPLVASDRFTDNLERIISQAQGLTQQVLFIGFTNCVESQTKPVAWCSLCYDNQQIKKYNNIMKAVCVEHNLLFIDVFGILEDTDFVDGLHPNASGHQKILEMVQKQLMII
ncbi:MAG: GDSL-type esterase/lipase family protein [Sphaerochaetaceae bacterium]|jgi:lysophospholipase L1-like esterase